MRPAIPDQINTLAEEWKNDTLWDCLKDQPPYKSDYVRLRATIHYWCLPAIEWVTDHDEDADLEDIGKVAIFDDYHEERVPPEKAIETWLEWIEVEFEQFETYDPDRYEVKDKIRTLAEAWLAEVHAWQAVIADEQNQSESILY
jgi:hypothetical protein